jgi:hypothetical protein
MRRFLFASQSLDAVSFALILTLIPFAIVGELNPFVVTMYAVAGVWGIMAAKIGLTFAVCWWSTGKTLKPLTRALIVIATVEGFMGTAFNLGSLATVFR